MRRQSALLIGLLGAYMSGCKDPGVQLALFAVPRELPATSQGVIIVGAELAGATSSTEAYCVRFAADRGTLTAPPGDAARDALPAAGSSVFSEVAQSEPRRTYAEFLPPSPLANIWIFAELFAGSCKTLTGGAPIASAMLALPLPGTSTNSPASDLASSVPPADLRNATDAQ